jgi:hypothetical protein
MGVLPEYTATTDPVKLPTPVMFHRGARVGGLPELFKKNTVPWPEIPEARAMPELKVVAKAEQSMDKPPGMVKVLSVLPVAALNCLTKPTGLCSPTRMVPLEATPETPQAGQEYPITHTVAPLLAFRAHSLFPGFPMRSDWPWYTTPAKASTAGAAVVKDDP